MGMASLAFAGISKRGTFFCPRATSSTSVRASLAGSSISLGSAGTAVLDPLVLEHAVQAAAGVGSPIRPATTKVIQNIITVATSLKQDREPQQGLDH